MPHALSPRALPLVALSLALAACGPVAGGPLPGQAPAPAASGPQPGSLVADGQPTHLAIQGPAYFILATQAQPQGLEQLRFTRLGRFKLVLEGGSRPQDGTWRLRTDDGLFVMGHQSPVDPAVRPFGTLPDEKEAPGFEAFTAQVTNGGAAPLSLPLVPLQLDLARNPNALDGWAFSPQGLVTVRNQAPKGPTGQDISLHLSLASFAKPEALARVGVQRFQHTEAAGAIRVGQAGDGGATPAEGPRVLARQASLKVGALEVFAEGGLGFRLAP